MDRQTPAVMQDPKHLTKQQRNLRLVTVDSAPDYHEFVAQVLHEEQQERLAAEAPLDQLELLDEQLLALGLPVAIAVGDAIPDVEDEQGDVHSAAVINIRTAQLHRHLQEMSPLHSKVVCLFWGIGRERAHSQIEIAQHIGMSRASVQRLLTQGMTDLCRRFDVLGSVVSSATRQSEERR